MPSEDESYTEPPSPKKVRTDSENDTKNTDEFMEIKKKRRRQKTKPMKPINPEFWLREQGERGSLNIELEERDPLFIADVQHLIMYSEMGHNSPYTPTRWCQLERFAKIKHVNILVVQNVSLYHYSAHETKMPFLSDNFTNKIEVVNPVAYSSSLIKDLINVPLTMTHMKQLILKFGSLENAVQHSKDIFDIGHKNFPIEERKGVDKKPINLKDNFPRTHLLLSGWQMVEENYPLPIKGLMERKYKGYVLSKEEYEPVTEKSVMLALDCEMVKTKEGSELGRVTVVNERYETIYDELVRPKNQIVNYLTQYSGITPAMMAKAKKDIHDVQRDLRKLIEPDSILVGQGLGNDMHALKMFHPYIIDTSVCFNMTGCRKRKSRLKHLAFEFLNEKIQQCEGNQGHDSAEDALASLKLVHLKLSRDLYFGDAVITSIEYQMKKHPQFGSPHFATSMLKQTTGTKLERTASVTAASKNLEEYRKFTFKQAREKYDKKVHFRIASGNEDVLEKMCDNINKFSLNLGHVEIEGDATGRSDVFESIDKWVKRMYESGSAPTMNIVIFGGYGTESNGCCFIQIKAFE